MSITNSKYKAASVNTVMNGTFNTSSLTEIADDLTKVVRRDLTIEQTSPGTPLVVTTTKSASAGGIVRTSVTFDKTYQLVNTVTGESSPVRGVARLELSMDQRLTFNQKRDVVGALVSWLLYDDTTESSSQTRVLDRLCLGEF